MQRTLQLILVSVSLVSGSACSKKEAQTYSEDDADEQGGGVAPIGGRTNSRPLVTIPVSFSSAGFELTASATTFTISLEDCASGYTSTADEQSTALQAYKFDPGCRAKLTTFSFNGRTYQPTASDPFTNWQADDLATFDESGEPGTYAVTVKVVSTLADPVSGAESIVYKFSDLLKGADTTLLEANVSASSSLTVESVDPPSFTIKSVELTEITANGQGVFTFVLECTTALVSTDVCAEVDMETMSYKLVQDTFNSTLVIEDAQTIFSTDGTAIAAPDVVSPGDSGTINGGFQATGILGPAQMALHPNMIFIIESEDSGNTSYQYFNVDVSTLTQN